jgi:uncharacterized membrane protein
MTLLKTNNYKQMKKKTFISAVAILFLIVSTAVFATDKPTKTTTQTMPDDVKAIVKKSCFGCHNSNSKNEDAKEELSFDKLDGLSAMKKISAFKHIGETVEENEMPPKKFVEKYPDKKLTNEEKQTLISWAKKEAEALVKKKF